MVTRDEILNLSGSLLRKSVVIQDREFWVREMTGAERDEWDREVLERNEQTPPDLKGLKARLLCLTLCDQDGRRLLGDEDETDLNHSMPIGMMEELVTVASALNKLLLTAKEVVLEEGN